MGFVLQIFFLLLYLFHLTCVTSIKCLQNGKINLLNASSSYEISVNESDNDVKVVTCSEESNSCYVVWIMNKTWNHRGCFTHSGNCANEENCVGNGVNIKGILYCCCLKDLCNTNFEWKPTPVPQTPTEAPKINHENVILFYLVYVLFPISMALVLFIMYLLKRRKFHYFNQIPRLDERPHPSPPTPRNEKLRPIKLEEIKARGKFGAVWKATDKSETVAVKILPVQEKQSWLTEQEILTLPFMVHDNILRLIAAEKRGDNLRTEYWLITAYHPLGSIQDFLKSNTITWEQFCHISYTMARGLAHLHGEIPPERSDPVIAHRDFKSSNVLLKNDFSACIADFGLALIFRPHRACGVTHGQVGTRRYMAPEVLEGAITFNRESFLRIDMYAFGLVLWELASRCSSLYQGSVPDYKLPFEAEVGTHPTLEDMQDIVVHQRRRPVISNSWYQHPGFSSLVISVEECWDHDSEARLTSGTIMERFFEQINSLDSPNAPLLCSNNIANGTVQTYSIETAAVV